MPHQPPDVKSEPTRPREMGHVTLAEALALVALYAEAEPAKNERAACDPVRDALRPSLTES